MLIWIVFGIILLIISVNDFLFFRIENEYVLSLIILYIIACICGISGDNFSNGFITAATTFVVTLILNHFNLIGGGDVKLLFPMILFSENNLFAFLLGTSIGGMLLATTYIFLGKQICLLRRSLITSLLHKKHNTHHLLIIVLLSLNRINKKIIALKMHTSGVMKQEIPYGVAISCGGFYVIVENLVVR